MDLVNEKHIVGLQIGEQPGQVAGLVDDRSRGDAQVHPHLVGNDVRQRGFSQSGRAVEQHMVQSLAPRTGRLHKDNDVLNHFLLPVEIAEIRRTDGSLKLFFRS